MSWLLEAAQNQCVFKEIEFQTTVVKSQTTVVRSQTTVVRSQFVIGGP